MDKVKQLEKYIEPLRRMITKIGTDDQVRKYQGNFMCHDSEDGSCKRDIASDDKNNGLAKVTMRTIGLCIIVIQSLECRTLLHNAIVGPAAENEKAFGDPLQP